MRYLIGLFCLLPSLAFSAPLIEGKPVDFDVVIPNTKSSRPFLIANLRTSALIPDGYYIVVTTKDHKSIGLAGGLSVHETTSYILSLSGDMLTTINGEKHAYLQAVFQKTSNNKKNAIIIPPDITITVEE